ncbi:unnamed protein product [Spirodela intermedia]|uniref:DUF220 domain-containing protein n=1 Tax=Spirodela intermedia TaxID=51605 RepID=A0A7I8KWW7_SPIIN|nr:unnamed protein product [Spirodela intermedia]
MDQKKERGDLDTSGGKRIGPPTLGPAFNFMVQFSNRVQSCFKTQFKRSFRNDEGGNGNSALFIEREADSLWKLSLEKQLQAWRENPTWDTETPEIKVTVPKGSLCNLNVKFKVGLPPDAIYNIVIDPDNRRVFKNIKEVVSRKVLIDEGSRQVVEVEQTALWRFLWWSGTISVHVFVDQSRKDHTIRFKQGNIGFMKRFEGCWRVEPLFVDEEICSPQRPRTLSEYESCSGPKGRVGSLVTLEQLVQPTIVPPPPISWYLRGITARTTEMLVTDLLAEADRLRSFSDGSDSPEEDNGPGCTIVDSLPARDAGEMIKERWRLRRRARKNP